MRNDRWRIFEQLYGGPNPHGQEARDVDAYEAEAEAAASERWSHLSGAEQMARRRWVGLDAWRRNAPDDHPGWDLIPSGFRRVTRVHGMPGHRCAVCDQLNRELGRLPDLRRAA